MKNRVKTIVAIIILIVLAGAYSVVDKTNSIYDTDIDSSEYVSIEMGKDDEISQSFVVKESRLNGVSVKMSANGNVDGIEVHYMLKDENGNTVAEGDKSLEELKAGKFFKVSFGEITVTRGKKYTFHLMVKDCDEESQVIVFGVPDMEGDLKCVIDGGDSELTIAFRTIVHRFDVETFVVIICFGIYVVVFMKWLTKMFK